MNKLTIKNSILSAIALGFATQANAVVVSWTDWTAVTATAPGAIGELTADGSTVDVTYSGPYAFVTTDAGTNYWTEGTPAPYTAGEVENAPPASDIVALNAGGTKTITFSEAIQDPYLALVSWNGNTVDFGDDVFEVISEGAGFWGSGTIIPNADNTGFFGSGEVHGIIKFEGSFTSLTFTDTPENWHGFTIGVAGLADDGNGDGQVPIPGTLALLGIGGFGVFFSRRRPIKAT
jgi:hypothetical protein